MSELDDFTEAVRTLHREKDRAYGTAWKRRGELLSIVANIARKVDRIEHGLQSPAEATRDESAIDTAVDLVVYGIKYQTYLADLDFDLAEALFSEMVPTPYSDGTEGFEALLVQYDLSPIAEAEGLTPADASRLVVDAFAGLEGWIATSVPTSKRMDCAGDLCAAAVGLIGALRRARPDAFSGFVAHWLGATAPAAVQDGCTTLVMRLAPDARDELSQRAIERGISLAELVKRSVALEGYVWEHRDELTAKHSGPLRRILSGG